MEVFIAIGIVLVVIGVPLAWYGVHRHRKQGERHSRASSSWTKTRATVVDARLVDRESTDSDGDSTTWYEPQLRYRYQAGARELEGQRAALCNTPKFWAFDAAQKWLLAHSPGTEIDLWYDPQNPEDSAPLLDKPSLFSAIIMVAVGAGFTIFGVAMLIGMV